MQEAGGQDMVLFPTVSSVINIRGKTESSKEQRSNQWRNVFSHSILKMREAKSLTSLLQQSCFYL